MQDMQRARLWETTLCAMQHSVAVQFQQVRNIPKQNPGTLNAV